MKDRKTFLTGLGVAGAAIALGRAAEAQQTPTPAATSSPRPAVPAPPPKRVARPAKRPSAAALAVAATFRRFDPRLDDAEVETIARGIDDSVKGGTTLNPKKKPLGNGDEPVTTFTVTG